MLLIGAGLALALTVCDGTPNTEEPEPSPPERIILVVIDTLRRDHVTGGAARVATPHIDALARRGQIVDPAVASFHQTTMSMASLFTGRTPSLESDRIEAPLEWNGRTWCGMRRFAGPGDGEACIPASVPTLAEALAACGYWTAGVATNPLIFRPAGYDRGFDLWIEVGDDEDSSSGRSGAAANRAVAELLDSRPGDRFFLYVHVMDVHDYLREERGYSESIAMADRAVGELVAMLDAEDLLEDAVLILTADHGERLDDRHVLRGTKSHHGNPSFEEVLRVPLIVVPTLPPGSLPGTPRGEDVHRLVKRVAGIEEMGPRDLDPDELFVSEIRYQTYRRGPWKSYRPRGGPLVLVNLEADPRERDDVAALHPEVVALHTQRMDELSGRLAAESEKPTGLTEEDERRLRVLGYLE